MKNLIAISILIFLLHPLFAQEEYNPLPYEPKEPAYDLAPQFPGGAEALRKYYTDSIRYPEPERSKGLQGYVLVKFMVTEEGKIKEVKLINGVPGAPNFAAETLRLLYSMPPWIPATKDGKPVEVEYNLAVPFKLPYKYRKY